MKKTEIFKVKRPFIFHSAYCYILQEKLPHQGCAFFKRGSPPKWPSFIFQYYLFFVFSYFGFLFLWFLFSSRLRFFQEGKPSQMALLQSKKHIFCFLLLFFICPSLSLSLKFRIRAFFVVARLLFF